MQGVSFETHKIEDEGRSAYGRLEKIFSRVGRVEARGFESAVERRLPFARTAVFQGQNRAQEADHG